MTFATPSQKHVMIVAGESSGDALGADLMAALRLQDSDVQITGVGGPKMQASGLASLFAMQEIALMGLKEILPKLPKLFKLVDATVAHALASQPDVMVLIDSPEFNHRVAKRVKKQRPDLPIICYVAPQVWAWRPGRAKKMRHYFDAVMAFLPFEPDVFKASGGPPCHFVGHPMVDRLQQLQPLPDFRKAHKLKKDDVLLSVLPGSRFSEIKVLTPVFGAVIDRLARDMPNLKLALPVLPHTRAWVEEKTANWAVSPILVEDESEKMAAFNASRAALASCGTATLELGLAGLPTIGAYNMGWFGSMVMRVMRVPSTILTNLILDKPVMLEFLQDRCTAQEITPALRELLQDEGLNEKYRQSLSEVLPALSYQGQPPAQRAAAITLKYAS
jgi:lipid-A-disaccharide synthase